MTDIQLAGTNLSQPPDWRVTVARSAIKPGVITGFELGDTKIIIVENEGLIYALSGTCPHAGAPLAKGGICQDKIVCPWHMGEFRIRDGAWLAPPPLRGLATYETRLEDGLIYVNVAAKPAAPAVISQAVATKSVLMIGGGAAATAALCALREFGFTGEIDIFDSDASEPIDRTLLSKNALAGKAPLEKLPLLDAVTREKLNVRYHAQKIVHLDAATREIRTLDGTRRTFEVAILATGGAAKHANVPGKELAGIYTLRHRADLEKLLTALPKAERIVIVGASFIGLEAASALSDGKRRITVVGPDTAPFVKQFGPRIATAIQRLHEKNGITFMMNTRLKACRGTDIVQEIETDDGRVIPADLVIMGLGVDLHDLEITGVERLENGAVVVNERLEAAPGLYAAGDVAAVRTPGNAEPLRIEHWRLAQQHGYAVAREIVGWGQPFTETPFFWSQQHAKRLVYVGHAATWDEIVVDGDPDAFEVIAWFVQDGTVAAAFTCGREWATTQILELLKAKPTLTQARAAVER